MKNLIFALTILLVFFQQKLFSEDNYFGDVTEIPLTPTNENGSIYFGIEKINSDYLDIAVTQANIIGQWNLNNGNGTFETYNNFNTYPGTLMSNIFIKLRPGSPVKDLIVSLLNGIHIYWNENGEITDNKQMIASGGNNWTFFERGVFDANDNTEDVLVSNASSTFFYCINLNNGYLSNPYSINLPHSISNFKLRQLNEKTDGYVQTNADDRSDLIFINRFTGNPDVIYAYLNNNNNGFSIATEFSNFYTNPPYVSDLEVADLDGDGYNDLITICSDGTCPTYYYARAYKNVQGQFINENTLMWSANLTLCTLSCGVVPKICVTDINKDGYNDIIFVMNRDDGQGIGIRAKIYINQYPNSLYSEYPQEIVDIAESIQPSITQATAIDIYGGQQHDGGGIALLVSNLIPINGGTNSEYHVKVINASNHYTNPPPPIVQGFLEYDHDNVWHPHVHLNNRGERDFRHYEIWKWKQGMPEPILYFTPVTDTGWTDYAECVDASGHDSPWWNCYYYAKEVDFAYKVSIGSQLALFSVGCIPVCDACGDNPNFNLAQIYNETQHKVKPPEKFMVSNYPNPFNPNTIIRFTLPITSKVKITVFNIVGQVVRELTNGDYEPGLHTVQFNGSDLSSGVYFYRIETQSFNETHKMLLLK